MSGGQHRVDEVTRTESRRLDSKNNPRIAAHRPPKETADCAMQESVRKEQKKSQTLLTWPTSLEMLRTGIITTYQAEIAGNNRSQTASVGFCWQSAIFLGPYRLRHYLEAFRDSFRNRSV
jgi:hypothetical protein